AAALWLAAGAVLLFLTAPLAALVWQTTRQVGGVSKQTLATLQAAAWLTAITSGIALALILLFGTPLAFLLARRQVPSNAFVETLIDLPMVLPPAVAGISLLMAFGRRGIIGEWLDRYLGITVGFTPIAVVCAQAFVAAPFYIRTARAGFAYVARDLELAAAGLGASPAQVFRAVTLPLAVPSLAAGAVLAWARALGEFGATIMFAGNLPGRTQTMSLAIYGRYEAGDLPAALLLASVLLAGSLLALLSARALGARGPTAPGLR
ncbi:MAG: molybdate ABC transporter permease subunit, partial [Chloroflexota bacterium]